MKKCKILVPIGCRSDAGLSAPIIKRLDKHTLFDVYAPVLTHAGDYFQTILECERLAKYLGDTQQIPDLVLIVGDRIEMCAIASYFFHKNIKIAHVYAGIIDHSFVVFDDINRHVITLYADIAFCESEKAMNVVADLWSSIGKGDICYFYDCDTNFEGSNIYNVGISHLDDLEIDESLVPDEPYDLIVYNPITQNKEIIEQDIIELHNHLLPDRRIIWIEPNPDLQWNDYPSNFHTIGKESSKPRPQFLGLLKRCTRYITNSSNVNYEALPLGLKEEQIIQIGLRNKNRSTPKKLETGASSKIVSILKKYWENKK